jgi:hypothetical protein
LTTLPNTPSLEDEKAEDIENLCDPNKPKKTNTKPEDYKYAQLSVPVTPELIHTINRYKKKKQIENRNRPNRESAHLQVKEF